MKYTRLLCGGALCIAMSACDTFMSEAPTAGESFVEPFEGLDHDLNNIFAIGDENFERPFAVSEGLGPIFNNIGCEGCHPGDGRGTPELGFFRFSRDSDLVPGEGGPQHQDKAIPGIPLELVPAGVDRSFRMPPPVFGVGLIEAIPVETILANEDPGDSNGDGISGRANWVQAADFVPESQEGGGPGVQLGRFSRKAQVSSLLQQVAEAYHQDMGITNDFLPEENTHPQIDATMPRGDMVPDPEISAGTVLETVMYVRLLAPPNRGKETAEVRLGEELFSQIGCASCHTPTMRTGPNQIEQLANVEAHLYSDLLLHDMGPGLEDGRPDGDADGREWRTAPLWGLRLVPDFLGGKPFYMHDGRTSDLDEAIRMHGGEAETPRDRYVGLTSAEQTAVVAFLSSL